MKTSNENRAIEHPSVRACLQFLGIEEGVEIHHIADLPARTGLGTSSAFTVGLLLSLYALKERMRDKHALTADAIHVEQEVLREAVGSQDQVSAAYGGFNRINFNVDGSIRCQPGPNFAREIGCTRESLRALLHRIFSDRFGDCQRADQNDSAQKARTGFDVSDGE